MQGVDLELLAGLNGYSLLNQSSVLCSLAHLPIHMPSLLLFLIVTLFCPWSEFPTELFLS